jgi:hypothetical protein
MKAPPKIYIQAEDLQRVVENGDDDMCNVTILEDHFAKDDPVFIEASIAQGLADALGIVEWSQHGCQPNVQYCPMCSRSKEQGHFQSCALTMALDTYRKGVER